jgi:hypothetical protein
MANQLLAKFLSTARKPTKRMDAFVPFLLMVLK